MLLLALLACAALHERAVAPAPKPLGPEAARLSAVALRLPLADRPRATRRIAHIARIAAQRLSRPEVSNLVAALHRDNPSAPAGWAERSDRRWLAAQLSIALVGCGALLRARTLNTLVSACTKAGELEVARALVGLADEPGGRVRPYSNATLTRLLVAHTRAADADASADLARNLANDDAPKDLPLYNAILQTMLYAGAPRRGAAPRRARRANAPAPSRTGRAAEVQRVLVRMRAAGVDPSDRTFNILIKGFARRGSLDAALEVPLLPRRCCC